MNKCLADLQCFTLDRIVGILEANDHLDRLPESWLPRWTELRIDLRSTIETGNYGENWFHKGWEIVIHGNKLFTRKLTEEILEHYRQLFESIKRPR